MGADPPFNIPLGHPQAPAATQSPAGDTSGPTWQPAAKGSPAGTAHRHVPLPGVMMMPAAAYTGVAQGGMQPSFGLGHSFGQTLTAAILQDPRQAPAPYPQTVLQDPTEIRVPYPQAPAAAEAAAAAAAGAGYGRSLAAPAASYLNNPYQSNSNSNASSRSPPGRMPAHQPAGPGTMACWVCQRGPLQGPTCPSCPLQLLLALLLLALPLLVLPLLAACITLIRIKCSCHLHQACSTGLEAGRRMGTYTAASSSP
jgi:hypothetical protein